LLPNDRLVCVLIDAKDGSFKDWPLHITIVPWFRLELTSSDLVKQLSSKLKDLESFSVTLGEEAKMGRNKTVTLVNLPTPLEEIESCVRRFLKDHGAWLVDETTQRPRSFKPHVTYQKGIGLKSGERIAINELQLVEQKGDKKLVVGTINLNE